jgi:hypothetical protein
MKKSLITLLLLLTFMSCDELLGEDKGEKDALPVVSATNFEITIAENPSQDQVLGTIQHTYNDATNNRGFEFVSSEDPNNLAGGYISIARETGQITVSSPDFFDYEQITTATGNAMLIGFNASDKTDTAYFSITIHLTDVSE